jgi:hypothetical protein
MLLLAPELLPIAVCSGSDGSKLGTVDSINGLVTGECRSAARASTTA